MNLASLKMVSIDRFNQLNVIVYTNGSWCSTIVLISPAVKLLFRIIQNSFNFPNRTDVPDVCECTPRGHPFDQVAEVFALGAYQ